MHVSLGDVLMCPRCGPGFPLVLLPSATRDRRVREGVLGCANCRERYGISGGVAELVRAGEVVEAVPSEGGDPAVAGERAIRLAALLGLAEASGVVLIAGHQAADAAALAGLVEGVEVAVVSAEIGAGAGYSVVRLGRVLPFQSGSLRGVALRGRAADRWLEEGARVLGLQARLVVEPAPARTRERVEAAGLRVILEEAGTLVAAR